jgi:hypothetical protein
MTRIGPGKVVVDRKHDFQAASVTKCLTAGARHGFDQAWLRDVAPLFSKEK